LEILTLKNYFYTKNHYLLDHEVNVTFDEVLAFSEDEFIDWCKRLREAVVYTWDVLGCPPVVGYEEETIIDHFQQLEHYPVHEFLVKDEHTGARDVIRNTSNLGNCVNSWFPTMLKTRINYTKDVDKGKSIYDFFAQDELFDRFVKYARRHFRGDSFYAYSNPVRVNDQEYFGVLPVCETAQEFLYKFKNKDWGIWFSPKEGTEEYTGYNEKLKNQQYLTYSTKEIDNPIHEWALKFPQSAFNNMKDFVPIHQIRVYKKGQKLFPVGFKAWKVSFCQYAVNYPPLIAKYIWEEFTEEFKVNRIFNPKDVFKDTIYVWDPSSGWGGRLLGALAVNSDRHITYLGNDPNTDHSIDFDWTKYDDFHMFYTEYVDKGGLIPKKHTTLKFWQKGSEELQFDPEFQKYKGYISVVFTSPPYFAKEKYSNDPEQSCIKFSDYDSWKTGFLYPTLKTAYDWLRPGGYIVWNVADVKFDADMLPLEKDSCIYMETLGFRYVKTYKMALSQMPGGNRLDPDTNLPRAKNFIKCNGIYLKYEPLYVYQKVG
jgi:hypothetical protein